MTWSAYLNVTKDSKPRKLLVEALEYAGEHGRALDLGTGSGNDACYLLTQGFAVDAVDSNPEVEKLVPKEASLTIAAYDTFDFPQQAYDLVNAQYALPFNSPETFHVMFERLKASLKPGGVFAGQFFGPEDTWADRKSMTFFSRKEVEDLFEGLTIKKIEEKKYEGKTAVGNPKFWHVFEVIAIKS